MEQGAEERALWSRSFLLEQMSERAPFFSKEHGAELAPILELGAGAAPRIEKCVMPRLLRSKERRSALLGAAPFCWSKGVSALLFFQRSMERSQLQFWSLEQEREQLPELRSV